MVDFCAGVRAAWPTRAHASKSVFDCVVFTQNLRRQKYTKRHSHQGISSNMKCKAANCTTDARYGRVHRKPLFCKPHCAEGHWNVTRPVCESEGCRKEALFGLRWKVPLSCGGHKLKGYANVKHRRCASEGCLKSPYFGLVLNKPLSCREHQQTGYTDVVSKRCISNGCSTRAMFGLVWGKPISCGRHKQEGYVNVKSRTCMFDGCPKQPYFGLIWGKALSCGHRRDGYADVRSKRCGSSACILLPMIERGRGAYKIDGVSKCGDCMRSMHPDLVKTFKVRTEHFVLAELQRRMPELEDNFLSWDCPLPCAISTERADILWQIGSTLLHVEVDETATHEDDRNRLMRLLAGTDAVDHIVVRIHTHSYENFKPCVTKSQINGEWVVACRKKEFDRRMDLVVPEIRRLLAARESVVKVMFSNH